MMDSGKYPVQKYTFILHKFRKTITVAPPNVARAPILTANTLIHIFKLAVVVLGLFFPPEQLSNLFHHSHSTDPNNLT